MVEVAFYGDDFTGSTDAMVQFARVGLRTVLLVQLPSAPELAELAARYDVVGVAGVARALPPDEQQAEVRPVFEALWKLGPRLLQYKVCSTADSSPTRGSIGRALELGREICGVTTPTPVLIAQPELGRYTVFSHHFATESGTTHRLDRQPTMSTHPSTPMHESDLRLHLAAQTTLTITAEHLHQPLNPTPEVVGGDVVVLDALSDGDLRGYGERILGAGFAVGSGGLSRAVGLALRSGGDGGEVGGGGLEGRVLVVSGSRSRRTQEQIAAARGRGWVVLPVGDGVGRQAVAAFEQGVEGVVVHSNELSEDQLAGLPGVLAEAVRMVSGDAGVRRLVVAGGDTSGQVLRELEVAALEFVRSVAPGVHLCRASSPHFDEVLLKPGQLGPVDLFSGLSA
ncbi:four-carbon acid sugar kinase family protein [Kribbella sp. WER1]